MWTVRIENAAQKALAKAPRDVEEKFNAWALVVEMSGPAGLRAIKGFHDEKLQGKLKHLRSSRLGLQWRVLYRVDKDVVTVVVEQVTPHVY